MEKTTIITDENDWLRLLAAMAENDIRIVHDDKWLVVLEDEKGGVTIRVWEHKRWARPNVQLVYSGRNMQLALDELLEE